MYRYKVRTDSKLEINDCVEGEHIETKVERIVHNNEPIKDGAPLIYTERKDGVQASTDIRTDRFEVAIDATDKIAKSYKARREEKPKVEESKKTEDKGSKKTEDKGSAGTDGGSEANL